MRIPRASTLKSGHCRTVSDAPVDLATHGASHAPGSAGLASTDTGAWSGQPGPNSDSSYSPLLEEAESRRANCRRKLPHISGSCQLSYAMPARDRTTRYNKTNLYSIQLTLKDCALSS
jgi:hypothetical protein